MKRLAMLVSVVALVAGACSSPASAPGVSGDSSSSTSTLSSDTSVSESDAPVAPDFTLALASGESFTLSDASKPVYMVFWAEW
jgi:hypothetical protein